MKPKKRREKINNKKIKNPESYNKYKIKKKEKEEKKIKRRMDSCDLSFNSNIIVITKSYVNIIL